MKKYLSIQILKTALPPTVTLIFFSFGLLFFTTNIAYAKSRAEVCEEKATPSGIKNCLDKLELDAFKECIVKPKDQQQPCVEEFKNGGSTTTTPGDGGSTTTTPADSGNEEADRAGTISNADRDRYRNCNGAACLNDNPIIIWTKRIINFLAAGVGIVTTIMIIIGGIQYASAGPNPQAVASAKKKIVNAIIALLAYFFLYGFMQWLIPGGLF